MLAFIPFTATPTHILTEFTSLLNAIQPHLAHRVTSPLPPVHLSSEEATYLRALVPNLHHLRSRSATQFLLHPSTPTPPPRLLDLATRASHLTSHFPLLGNHDTAAPHPNPIHSRLRSASRPHSAKQTQIRALRSLISNLSTSTTRPISRVVDIGAGHAHLASLLADSLPSKIPVLAIDQDPHLIFRARSLHKAPNLTLREQTITPHAFSAQPHDLVVGLHPCGQLGDHLISSAHGASAVVMVSCCLQKIPPHLQFREPLSKLVNDTPALRLALQVDRHLLGVTNRPGAVREAGVNARVTRYALRTLLQEHGLSPEFGEEVQGLSRHALKNGLHHILHRVAEIHSISISMTSEEANRRMSSARHDYDIMRAYSIPRTIAGEVLEMGIVLDRAAALEEAGFRSVRTCRPWLPTISPRCLCCVAWN